MKLKQLFLASLALASLASCSDNEGGVDIPDYKLIETSLSISAIPNVGTITRASELKDSETEVGAKGEAFVNTLTAIVFNDDEAGLFSAIKTVKSTDGKSLDKIEDIVVKVQALEAGEVSTSAFKVVLIANVDNIEAPKDWATFESSNFSGILNYTFGGVNGEKQTQYLPMSSAVMKVKGLVAGTEYDNWIDTPTAIKVTPVKNVSNAKVTIVDNKVNQDAPDGEEYKVAEANRISLIRYMARVQLESLSANFTQNYEDAKFELTSVSLANVSNASLFVDGGSGLQCVLGSGENGAYADNAFYRGCPDKIVRADYYLAEGVYNAEIFSKSDYSDVVVDNKNTVEFADATTTTDKAVSMAQFYAFEFGSYDIAKDDNTGLSGNTAYTMLIITGNITGVGPTKEARSFRIPIKHDANTNGVKRNYIYKVHATLTGEGTDNPDKNMLNAFVSFSIDVEQWQVIKQTETDVN